MKSKTTVSPRPIENCEASNRKSSTSTWIDSRAETPRDACMCDAIADGAAKDAAATTDATNTFAMIPLRKRRTTSYRRMDCRSRSPAP